MSDVLSSSLDENELAGLGRVPGVATVVGVLVETERLNAGTALFLEIGIAPQELAPFEVHVVAGWAYSATAPNQMMLGWRAAGEPWAARRRPSPWRTACSSR